MRASEFKSFIENNNIEWHRYWCNDGKDVVIFPEFNDLEEFTKILGYGLVSILGILILMGLIEYIVALLYKNKKYGLPDYKHAPGPPPPKYSKCYYYFYVSKSQLKAKVTALKDTHTLKKTYYDKDVKSYVAVFRKKTVK